MTSRDDAPRVRPGAIVAGLVFLAIAAGYGLDAAGRWHPWPLLAVPAAAGGLVLAGVTGATAGAVRRRRRRVIGRGAGR